jgi:hypothetical protein
VNAEIVNGINLSALPEVLLGQHTEWAALNRLAWRLGARNVRTTHGHRHMDCGFKDVCNYQWVWDSCFMTLF